MTDGPFLYTTDAGMDVSSGLYGGANRVLQAVGANVRYGPVCNGEEVVPFGTGIYMQAEERTAFGDRLGWRGRFESDLTLDRALALEMEARRETMRAITSGEPRPRPWARGSAHPAMKIAPTGT